MCGAQVLSVDNLQNFHKLNMPMFPILKLGDFDIFNYLLSLAPQE